MSARDLFESAHDAAWECERCRRQLLAMRESSGAGSDIHVSRGSISDPMARVDRIIDREARWESIIERDEALMDYATAVLYGRDQDGNGGVDALLGSVYADVLWWHYLALETWERVGRIVHYSPERCKQLRDIAFDVIDANGLLETVNGIGMAEG